VELQQRKARLETRLAKADQDDKEDLQRSLSKVNLQITSVKRVYGDSTRRKFDDDELSLAVVENMKDSLQQYDLPKEVRERLNRKVKDLAKISALSFKAKENAIVVVEDVKMDAPKSKQFAGILKSLQVKRVSLTKV